jgi:hypothetical protein
MVDADHAPEHPRRPAPVRITPSGGVAESMLLGMVDPPSMGPDPSTGHQPASIGDHPSRAVARLHGWSERP